MSSVAIGSLTNIANAHRSRHADQDAWRSWAARLAAATRQAHAELNIWADPHAAEVVFASGMQITVVPLDITRTYSCPRPMPLRSLAASPDSSGQTRAVNSCPMPAATPNLPPFTTPR